MLLLSSRLCTLWIRRLSFAIKVAPKIKTPSSILGVRLEHSPKLFKFDHSSKWDEGSLPSQVKICLNIASLSALVLINIGAWQFAMAQVSSTPVINLDRDLTTQQVVDRLVQKNLERATALTGYRGTRIYRLEYHGFPGDRSAEMTVDVNYRSPGTKEFVIQSETGSRLLIERVFHKLLQSEKEALTAENQAHVALNSENYRFALFGYESMPTGPCYVLFVEPLTKSKLLYRGRIWVNAEDFAVVRIEAAPAKNPSFWTKETRIEQLYLKVGNFWLPASNRSSSSIRLGGQAEFTIAYQDYQITATAPLPTANTTTGSR